MTAAQTFRHGDLAFRRGDLTLDQRLRVEGSQQMLAVPRVALTRARCVHSVTVSGSCIRRTPGGEQR